ncbi:ABC-F family ATP-binding cassette domain-containing protein [Candidatus Gracilibacteria bacterium]|nr:ABC-F family ATP-binding cassette domain-containing protein [Candidatus Gracilibacteria bacterium]
MKHLRVKIDKYEVDGNIILKDIDFIFNQDDKVALVGGNGVGKTTLLKIITGQIKDFDGSLENIGNITIGYLSQIYTDNEEKTVFEEIKDGFLDIKKMEFELKYLEEKMMLNGDDMELIEKYTSLLEQFNNIGGYSYENIIHQVANGMQILHLLSKKLSEISGGERTKVALCKILVEKPDIICLDEPTNFIDMKSVEWLESYLQNKWGNGYLIISHDREFLDKTCDKTYELQPARQINFYHYNYSRYVNEREKIEDIKLKDFERQQEYIKKEENLINRFRAGSRASFAQSREKALERLEKLEKPYIPQTPKFFFDYVGDENERILYFKEVFIGRKEPLFYINELYLNKGQRVGLVGENGAGKSTFLKTIMGELEVLDGIFTRGKGLKIIYYSQLHEELDKEKSIYDNFINHGINMSEQNLIGYLKYYLIEKEALYKPVKYLSGGQISKVLFAILGQKESNFLIFDEPTNHLDYDSRESLEKAISNYKGTILFISHDRYFVNKVAQNLWIIKDQELILSYGNYEDYRYKLENGIDIEMNLFDESAEMDMVLLEKVGEKELKRIKDKFARKKK